MEPIPEVEWEPYLTEVGRCLNNFSRIEVAIEHLFSAISDIHHAPGPVIMASIISVKARLAVCENVTKVGPLPADLSNIWKRLRNRMLDQLVKRNEVAHFRLMNRQVGKGKPVMGIEPYGSFGGMMMNATPGPFLTLEQLKNRAAEFLETAEAGEWLAERIKVHRGHPEPLAIFRRPEPHLVQALRDKDTQTPAAHPEPPATSGA